MQGCLPASASASEHLLLSASAPISAHLASRPVRYPLLMIGRKRECAQSFRCVRAPSAHSHRGVPIPRHFLVYYARISAVGLLRRRRHGRVVPGRHPCFLEGPDLSCAAKPCASMQIRVRKHLRSDPAHDADADPACPSAALDARTPVSSGAPFSPGAREQSQAIYRVRHSTSTSSTPTTLCSSNRGSIKIGPGDTSSDGTHSSAHTGQKRRIPGVLARARRPAPRLGGLVPR